MKETLSTFPVFATILKESKGDWEKAQVEFFIKVANWHETLVTEVNTILDNESTQLQGLTAKMILKMLLGENHK